MVLYFDKNQLFVFVLWFGSHLQIEKEVHMGSSYAVMKIEEVLGPLPLKTFVFKIWLHFSSFSLGHCCPPWTKYSDVLCEITVLKLESDKIKHSGIDCASESWLGSLSLCSWPTYSAQIVVSLPLSFSSYHPIVCRDSSEDVFGSWASLKSVMHFSNALRNPGTNKYLLVQ